MRALTLKIFFQQQLALLPVLPPAFYLLGLLYRLNRTQLLTLLTEWGPWIVPALGFICPLGLIHFLTEHALRQVPGEAPGARLRRILVLPRQIELGVLLAYLAGDSIFTIAVCKEAGRSLTLVFPTLLVLAIMNSLASVIQTLRIEALLRPVAVEEFERHPTACPAKASFLWPRQVWYLPYVITIVLAAAVVSFWVILDSKLQTFMEGVRESVLSGGPEALAAGVPAKWEGQLLNDVMLALWLVLGYVLVFGALTALAVARRQRSGSRAVELAVRALASGNPVLPKWPATDELGDLAFATAEALGGLREKALTIAASARAVDEVARELATLVSRQRQVVTDQSNSLRQSQLTAEEIKQTSDLASGKARLVLSAAGQAEHLGQSGREAVDSSVKQLGAILAHATEMSAQVSRLRERAHRIDRITLLVKDLADQTNMVALNAAIEAMRAGESGRTFSVVAQQIRRLSDASASASAQVREVLRDVEGAIREVVHLSDAGKSQAASSMDLATEHGENLRKLTGLVEDGANSARQISAAVTEQATGIDLILAAIASLGETMGQTMDAMKATEELGVRAERIAREVAGAMAGYEWRSRSAQPAPGLPE